MAQPRDDRQEDLFRPAPDQIIDMGHPLVRLAEKIDWGFLDQRLGEVYRPGDGHPPLPVRLMAGLLILKHMHSLSDEALCARWVENPYFQYFCGEEVFRHELRFDRSSLTRWRQRLGEEPCSAPKESLRVAHESGTLATKDRERVAVDTTVQPKAVAHPTDARLTHKVIENLVGFARGHGIALRQSYLRVAKRAAIMVGRYTQPTSSSAPPQVPAHPVRPADPRHQPQDRRGLGARTALRCAPLDGLRSHELHRRALHRLGDRLRAGSLRIWGATDVGWMSGSQA